MKGDKKGDASRFFALFESRTNLERGGTPHLRQYRLARMEDILRRLGEPHLAVPVVHIAGTKGKGSTGAFTAALLAATGLRVGLYTSPHVNDYRERFSIFTALNDRPDAKADRDRETLLARECRRVWSVVTAMKREGVPDDDLPTTFELLTALAFRFFPAAACEMIVLETGLGGRLDATNLCRPVLTMITRIELEHQEYLGNTLGEIAREKAGIIKAGVPVIIAPQRREARTVLDRVARDRGAPIVSMHPIKKEDEIHLAMCGRVQRVNGGHALAAYRNLLSRGFITELPTATVHRTLETTSLPGRSEHLSDCFLDGAHTPESVAHAARSLNRHADVAILGVVQGKDIARIAAALRGRVRTVIVSRPGTFKPGDPATVHGAVVSAGLVAELVPDPLEALCRARALRRGSAPILVTGSFYMVGEIRRLLLREVATGAPLCP